MFKDLSSWLNYLDKLHPTKIDFDLDRVVEVATRMGLLYFDAKVIVVGGTNGKGTTCALLESILFANEYSVGVFSSPHISRFNERIRLNGQEVNDSEIIDAFKDINIYRNDISLTYFEYTTLAALYIFKNYNLSFIILEVGLGGRLDAVNIVHRDVAIITSIGIDHTNYLGDSVDAIGREKAYIYKDNCYAIIGVNDFPSSVDKYIIEHSIDLHVFGRDFKDNIYDNSMSWSSGNFFLENLALPSIVPVNLSCALECLKGLELNSLLKTELINNGLNKFNLFGRLTVVKKKYSIIFDVAHNLQAIENLSKKLQKTGTSLAVFAMCKDKDIYNTINTFIDYFDHWYVVIFDDDLRMAEPTEYDLVFRKLAIKNYTYFSLVDDLVKNTNELTSSDQLVVFGSFSIVEKIKHKLHLFAKS